MDPGGKDGSSSYSGIVPVELLLALFLPLAAFFLFDLGWLPTATFLIASLPAAVALYVHRFLPAPRSVILLGGACYVAGMLLSTLVSTDLAPARFADLALPALLILYFLYLLSMPPRLEERHSGLLLLTLVVACGVNAGINAAHFLAGDPRAIQVGQPRLIAVFGVPGGGWPTVVSSIYAVSLAAGFTLAASPAQGLWLRVVAGLAVLPVGAALALTQARSGIVGALIGVLTAMAFVPRHTRLIALGSLAALMLVALALPGVLDAVAMRGASYRPEIWLSYLEWALEAPLFGQGLIASTHRMVVGIEFHHAHNLLISGWVRGGLLGLLGMAVMLGAGIYWSWRYARRFGNPVFLAMIVTAGVAGMFDYQLLLMPVNWTWVAFWLPIGLAAGAEIAVRRDRRMSRPAGPA